MNMTYSESAEGQMITINRAMQEVEKQGITPGTAEWREFETEVANLRTSATHLVPAEDVLELLGY
jgi:hypothetical protein